MISEEKILKLKKKGNYDNLLKVLEINPNFELKMINILEEPVFSSFGAEIIATTCIDQYTLLDFYKYSQDKEYINNFLEVLKYNPQFNLIIDSYYLLENKIFNLLGAELVSKIPAAPKEYQKYYYAFLECKNPKYLKEILYVNPKYISDIMKHSLDKSGNNIEADDIIELCEFWGVEIISQISAKDVDSLKQLYQREFIKYSIVKKKIINDLNLKNKLINLLKSYIHSARYMYAGFPPGDNGIDYYYVEKKEEIKKDIKILINSCI